MSLGILAVPVIFANFAVNNIKYILNNYLSNNHETILYYINIYQVILLVILCLTFLLKLNKNTKFDILNSKKYVNKYTHISVPKEIFIFVFFPILFLFLVSFNILTFKFDIFNNNSYFNDKLYFSPERFNTPDPDSDSELYEILPRTMIQQLYDSESEKDFSNPSPNQSYKILKKQLYFNKEYEGYKENGNIINVMQLVMERTHDPERTKDTIALMKECVESDSEKNIKKLEKFKLFKRSDSEIYKEGKQIININKVKHADKFMALAIERLQEIAQSQNNK